MQNEAITAVDASLQLVDPTSLQEELLKACNIDPNYVRLPDRDGPRVSAIFDHWFDRNYFVCQSINSRCQVHCNREENRCGSAYWRRHCAIVAGMMKELARERGEPSNARKMWHSAGLLHDLDYLRAPHDVHGLAVDRSHPIPLVLKFQAAKFPPILTLAILEHSPHLNLVASSQMSAALIGCDEAATLAAFGESVSQSDGVPEAVIAAITKHKVTGLATGKRRSNIRERMHEAFGRLNRPKSEFALPF